jgi:hypothetical protein
VNSRLSLRPLISLLRQTLERGKPGMQKLYGHMLRQFEARPELLKPQQDTSLMKKNRELVEMLMTTIFSPAAAEQDSLYAVAYPFSFDIVYASDLFDTYFIRPGTNQVKLPNSWLEQELEKERAQFACTIILQKYFGYQSPEIAHAVFPFADPATGLTRYFELNIDPRFIDVTVNGDMPVSKTSLLCPQTNQLLPMEELSRIIPLDKFVFEGLSVIRVQDITTREIISRIKNDLLDINAFGDATVYQRLHSRMQGLLGMKDVRIGITPFFKINNRYVYAGPLNSLSFIFRHGKQSEQKDSINDAFHQLFSQTGKPLVVGTITENDTQRFGNMSYYFDEGIRSLVICPLKNSRGLLGILEIVSDEAGKLSNRDIEKIEPALPLFARALEKSAESLVNQVDRVIKEQFTAVQPAVEWKFTETALTYLAAKNQHKDARLPRIAFHNVFPLFGAIDIRNSTLERAQAIRLDLAEQLERSAAMINKARPQLQLPLLDEVSFKINQYQSATAAPLQADEEMLIRDFLKEQVTPVLLHIRETLGWLKQDLDRYFAALNPATGMIDHHRKDVDDSIALINETLVSFIDQEQAAAQKAYPFYFERYVTDGVEFNMYIGQSITPDQRFDELYLKNIRMWQLVLLAKSAQMVAGLTHRLPLPLNTTQLILAHSNPLSISFRTEERSFDVDGANNMRYEILKKRIDKVHIKNSRERLTQPGKLAVVYSQAKEAEEYLGYTAFLQNRGLLQPGVEQLDLEELQGISGLKALRVGINMETGNNTTTYPAELSSLTIEQLINR